jgi:hypothetical protein
VDLLTEYNKSVAASGLRVVDWGHFCGAVSAPSSSLRQHVLIRGTVARQKRCLNPETGAVGHKTLRIPLAEGTGP